MRIPILFGVKALTLQALQEAARQGSSSPPLAEIKYFYPESSHRITFEELVEDLTALQKEKIVKANMTGLFPTFSLTEKGKGLGPND